MAEPLIKFDNVELGYPGRPRVLHDLTFEVEEGDFLGIVGPNGAGKSTILRAILGLLSPGGGKISWAGGGGPRSLHMGYVPQRQALDPLYPLRVVDVVTMGLYAELGAARRAGPEEYARSVQALESAGVAHLADRLYRELSGGQQQRTLVARALVSQPRLLVLDEPTNDLDLVGEKGIMDLVARLHKEGKTVLFVSHLLNVVANYAERLAIIHHGTLEVGPIDDMLTGEKLTRLYGIPVEVATTARQRVVLPEREGREIAS
jgi:ABC-type Mn2+/Zn2+ transport system ATPase subunit